MSQMVERAARAMAVADKAGDYWDVMSEDGDGYGYVGKNEYRVMARAAIEAMREPTEAMCRVLDRDPYGCEPTADMVWQAMINEALK